MRKRRLRLVLLAVALFGVVAWLVWPTTPPVITAAKEKYARLQLGMSEEEVTAILGSAPWVERQCYGEWVDDRKLYRLVDRRSIPNPEPGKKLYGWRAWTFDDYDSSGSSRHHVNVQTVFDQDRLVWLIYSEGRDYPAKKWLRGLGEQLSLRLPFLDVTVKTAHKVIPP